MAHDAFDLTGKVALVTGSSKGIGEAIAFALARQGAHVVVSSRKMDHIQPVAEAIQASGYKVLAIPCNVGDAEQRKHLISEIENTLGGIDILVNNAATNPVYGALEAMDAELFDKIMEVNVKAVWHLSNLCLPSMQQRGGGSIINISSVEGLHPGLGLGLYSTSKAALIMLTKNQANEWGKYGVRCNTICPGLIKTKFSAALWQNEALTSRLVNKLPSGRIGQPQDIEGLALLLASPAGDYLTGGDYVVDGGYLIAH